MWHSDHGSLRAAVDHGPAEDVYEMVNNGILRVEVIAIDDTDTCVGLIASLKYGRLRLETWLQIYLTVYVIFCLDELLERFESDTDGSYIGRPRPPP
jgi:hypothetical protein